MSWLCTDSKGDLFRNYAGIAKDYYGYNISVLDLRNQTRSDGDKILHLVNKYMDAYMKNPNNLSLKAKAQKYEKITAKTIITSSGEDASNYVQKLYPIKRLEEAIFEQKVQEEVTRRLVIIMD